MEDIELVFIHGFGGGPEDWNSVIANLDSSLSVRAIDLQKLTINSEISWPGILERVEAEVFRERPVVLCGYSLGGRIALQMAAQRRVSGLVLLSAGFGERHEKSERKQQDLIWADLLRKNPEEFWKKWYEQELFSSLKSANAPQRENWLDSRFRWNNESLADFLVRLSPANHEWLLPILCRENSPPTLYLVGEKDKKYVALSQLVEKETKSAVTVLKGVGHTIPLEAPEECARAINRFLLKK